MIFTFSNYWDNCLVFWIPFLASLSDESWNSLAHEISHLLLGNSDLSLGGTKSVCGSQNFGTRRNRISAQATLSRLWIRGLAGAQESRYDFPQDTQ